MDEHGQCVWNGEWGPVYARKEFEGEATDAINEERYMVLKEQLAIYNKVRTPRSHSPYRNSDIHNPFQLAGSPELVDLAL